MGWIVSRDGKKTPLSLPRFTPLLGTGRTFQNYVEVVNVEKKMFWIRRGEVSRRFNCVVVMQKADLRTGPGKKYRLVKNRSAVKHKAYRDLGGEEGWTQIQDESGKVAWIDLRNTWKPRSRYISLSFEK